jgi:hypothetical protein
MVTVSAELDRLIHEKRSQLKDAFAACRKAREAAANAKTQLTGIAPEGVADAQAEVRRLESEERDAGAPKGDTITTRSRRRGR